MELPTLVEDETGIMHMDLEFSIKEIKHAVSPPRRAPRRVGHLAEHLASAETAAYKQGETRQATTVTL
jgi:pyridoxal biosynthesis lyase PdxS